MGIWQTSAMSGLGHTHTLIVGERFQNKTKTSYAIQFRATSLYLDESCRLISAEDSVTAIIRTGAVSTNHQRAGVAENE